MMDLDYVLSVIDRATEPKAMSKEEALDFLERLETELQGRKEALRDELADET